MLGFPLQYLFCHCVVLQVSLCMECHTDYLITVFVMPKWSKVITKLLFVNAAWWQLFFTKRLVICFYKNILHPPPHPCPHMKHTPKKIYWLFPVTWLSQLSSHYHAIAHRNRPPGTSFVVRNSLLKMLTDMKGHVHAYKEILRKYTSMLLWPFTVSNTSTHSKTGVVWPT